jgi:hypothetical protein
MGVQGVRTSRIFLPGSLGLLKKYLDLSTGLSRETGLYVDAYP